MTHPELKARIASAYNAALDRRGQSAVSHRDHFGQRVVELADLRVQFRHAGVANVLPVTDPFAEWAWLAKPDGEYAVPGALLCISLGEPFADGYCYKLVATVLTPPSQST